MTNRLPAFFSSEKKLIAVSLTVIALYFLPYFVVGEQAPLTIPDNMDSNIVWAKMTLVHGGIFSSPATVYDQAMGGIPRSSLYWYDIRLVWFELFGMYWGYVINKLLMALIGFAGMFLFLKKHLLAGEQSPPWIIAGTALAFALVPHWSFTMSAAGIPLMFYAFFNFRKKEGSTLDWIITVCFAFYSSLVLSGFFFLVAMAGILVYDWLRQKKINFQLFTGLAVLSIGFIISHLPFFYSFLFDREFVSHRSEFGGGGYGLAKAGQAALILLFKGHFEVRSMSTLLWLPLMGAIFLTKSSSNIKKQLFLIVGFVLLTSLLYGFLRWNASRPVSLFLNKYLPIHLYRFYFLHPVAWYCIMAISLSLLYQHFKQKAFFSWLLLLFIAAQVAMVARYHEFYMNRKGPSFKQFYATSQYDKLKADIGKPLNSYRVLNLGWRPSPSIYNGLYTIDAYFANYPLAHKQAFRKIIKGELEQSQELRQHFDNWGSQCYAYTAQLGRKYNYPALKAKGTIIEKLSFDWDAAQALGASYAISVFPVDTVANPPLELVGNYTEEGAYWDLYLYKIL
jgi:hypothetical protein